VLERQLARTSYGQQTSCRRSGNWAPSAQLNSPLQGVWYLVRSDDAVFLNGYVALVKGKLAVQLNNPLWNSITRGRTSQCCLNMYGHQQPAVATCDYNLLEGNILVEHLRSNFLLQYQSTIGCCGSKSGRNSVILYTSEHVKSVFAEKVVASA